MSSFMKLGSAVVRTFVKPKWLQHCNAIAAVQIKPTGFNRQCGFATNAEKKEIDPRKLTESEWLQKLTPEQYYICREKGTEEPFSGKYYMHKEEGVYSCVCCGTELFSSKSKYDSGTGWPSFYEAILSDENDESSSHILTRPDSSLGTVRTEVQCKKCCAHLGHVFPDGPQPTGDRYCINSVALKFTPKKLT